MTIIVDENPFSGKLLNIRHFRRSGPSETDDMVQLCEINLVLWPRPCYCSLILDGLFPDTALGEWLIVGLIKDVWIMIEGRLPVSADVITVFVFVWNCHGCKWSAVIFMTEGDSLVCSFSVYFQRLFLSDVLGADFCAEIKVFLLEGEQVLVEL